ncbi:hypothetical protein N7486_003802 [Penicillium sp. IBT 16267x]|nr:hypothetical protein N7486_003802 [Penicillium sp. IBT 16267x]
MAILATLLAIAALPLAHLASAERVLGAYIDPRHGDRTAKALPPPSYNEEYLTGSFFNDRFISSSSAYQIEAISPKFVNLEQVTASSPQDNILRNGSNIDVPPGAHHLIPIGDVQSSVGSEDNTWLESTSTYNNVELSSNDYFYSTSYEELQSSTSKLYQSLAPLTKGAFPSNQLNYKNAYTIWDLFNVAFIHNLINSFRTPDLLSNQTIQQLFILANAHEFNLAYNSSEPIRAVAGITLTIIGGKSKLNVQFSVYSTFFSYFGLAMLTISNTFTRMPDYASSMAWELAANASRTGIPSQSEISVRFVFHNGPVLRGRRSYNHIRWLDNPLFRSPRLIHEQVCDHLSAAVVPSMRKQHLCLRHYVRCYHKRVVPGGSSSRGSKGLSLGDVIGAMVTVGILAGLTALLMLVFNLRLMRKNTLTALNRGSEISVLSMPAKAF